MSQPHNMLAGAPPAPAPATHARPGRGEAAQNVEPTRPPSGHQTFPSLDHEADRIHPVKRR